MEVSNGKKGNLYRWFPCSGKSTIATAAECNMQSCKKVTNMTADEIWMRDPMEQCREEFLIYKEISKTVFKKLSYIQEDFIVAEGVAFTPEIILFARQVERACVQNGITCIVNDGLRTEDSMYDIVKI